MIFCCDGANDLFRAFARPATRIPDPQAAVDAAPPGSAVLILAGGYPAVRTPIRPEVYATAAAKNLRLYVEFPDTAPDCAFGEPAIAEWERLVVLDERFGSEASILAAHACRYLPAHVDRAAVRIARVAGYDRAVFGVPESAPAILFEIPGVLVATTKLSQVRTGRYAPQDGWIALWQGILDWLEPGAPAPEWDPVVRPSFDPAAVLPPDVEHTAVARAGRWHLNSGLILNAEGERAVRALLAQESEAVPRSAIPSGPGDGRHGLLEGRESAIAPDGSQKCRLPLRADSVAETAMVLAAAAAYCPVPEAMPANLLDYVFTGSGMCAGDRGDPEHPAYGLIAWGVGSPAWEVANYGDDNARVLLAALLVTARTGHDRWTAPILRATLANLRTTGRLGFRGDRIDMPQLTANGWRHYFEAETVNRAPHFEAYLWACYLWAYRVTGQPELLDRARRGIGAMMAAFPGGWRRNDVTEPARMLLPLAWLVRIEDTAEHRSWIADVAANLLSDQDGSGAIPERECGGPGLFQAPKSNEEYGQTESPLIHQTGDPASDQLYTTGFALLGLHEAAAATGDAQLRERADRLAAYLVRIQTRSADPELDGTWLRAFDFARWDYFASSADAGWGAWSIELGWGQAWIVATLALRAGGSSLWDEVATVTPEAEVSRTVRQEMGFGS
ncbi:MAG TPA: hypothetical protein VHC49_21030 [Mycobacteriales bacterium]|nr:hypothetical protein [Mycobacteriales bacterium]